MQKSLEKALQKISSKLLITDKDLKVLFINSSAEDFLNTTSKKSIGKLIHDVFIEKPTNNLELLDLLEKKTYLKRHITTLFLEGGLKKKCSFVAYYLGEESESIVFEFFDAEIESIRTFNINNQLSISLKDKIEIVHFIGGG